MIKKKPNWEFVLRRTDWRATSDIWFQRSIKSLKWQIWYFASKHEELKSDLLITKTCNTLLHQRIIQLEVNAVNNAQYCPRKSVESNLVPRDIEDKVLEKT